MDENSEDVNRNDTNNNNGDTEGQYSPGELPRTLAEAFGLDAILGL